MDAEDKWTTAIRNRETTAFFPFARRMFSYAIANCLNTADTKQLRKDYGSSFSFAQGSGLCAIVYWNYIAMNLGIASKWTRVKWSLQSYLIGGVLSVPWSVMLFWDPMSRAFVSKTTKTTIREWRNPTGLIQHELLPNPPYLDPIPTESTPTSSPL